MKGSEQLFGRQIELAAKLARCNRAIYGRTRIRFERITPLRLSRVLGVKVHNEENVQEITRELGMLFDHGKIMIDEEKKYHLFLEPYGYDTDGSAAVKFCSKYNLRCLVGTFKPVHNPGSTTTVVFYK